MPSIATSEPKKRPCDKPALPSAADRWLTFAPICNQPPSRTGTVTRTARVKTMDMIFGPLFGSARKMWWISSSLP